MKRFSAALVLVFGVALATPASAGKRPFVKCPAFIVNKTAGTYRSVRSYLGGDSFGCSNNAAALRRQGYVIEGGSGDPPIDVGDPILDVERVIRFEGSGDMKKLFRVTTVGRVVTVTTLRCGSRFSTAWFTVNNSAGKFVAQGSVHLGTSESATIFNPGIYGISVGTTALESDSCSIEVKVQ